MLIAVGVLAAGLAMLFVPLLVIGVDTDGRLTSDPADVSRHQVALVLGAGLTAKGTPTDVTNPSPRYLDAHEQLHLQPAAVGAG
jgi:vancomycin permeability regulator SanA